MKVAIAIMVGALMGAGPAMASQTLPSVHVFKVAHVGQRMGVTEIVLHGANNNVLASFIGERPVPGQKVRVVIEPKQ